VWWKAAQRRSAVQRARPGTKREIACCVRGVCVAVVRGAANYSECARGRQVLGENGTGAEGVCHERNYGERWAQREMAARCRGGESA